MGGNNCVGENPEFSRNEINRKYRQARMIKCFERTKV